MKTTISIILSAIAVSGFTQNNTSQLFGYLNSKPADLNSCYQATPLVPLTVKKEQVLFMSTNGGTTWDDLSASLPEGIQVGASFIKNGEMYLGTYDGKIYYKNVTTDIWESQTIEGKTNESGVTVIAEGKDAMYITIYHEGIYKKVNGSNVWKPIHGELADKTFYGVVETSDGAVLVGTNSGIYLLDAEGKTWQHVYNKSWAHTFVTGSGILLANNSQGLIRSKDGGKSWDLSLDDEGGFYNNKIIDGYFVAIRTSTRNPNHSGKNYWVNISTDGGSTWHVMDSGNPSDHKIDDVIKMGDYWISARRTGVSRSKDMGKTWQLIMSPEDDQEMMRFDLHQSGETLFAIIKLGGC